MIMEERGVLCVILISLISSSLQSLSFLRHKRADLMPVNAIKTLTICNGAKKSIVCPNLQLIRIFNAFYGKLSGHDCQQNLRTVRNQIPTCMSKDAANVIKDTCHGQQSCDLFAEDSLYNNPCPTVNKYLFVAYACEGQAKLPETLKMFEKQGKFSNLPELTKKPFMEQLASLRGLSSPVQNAVVCSGQIGSIACPNLKLIRVHNVFYGKQQGRDCSGKLTRDSITTCFAKDAIHTIQETCQGQQSCDLFSENDLYGRSLCSPNTEQYLHVQYSCEGKSNLIDKLVRSNTGGKSQWAMYANPYAARNPWMARLAYSRSPYQQPSSSPAAPLMAMQRPHSPWVQTGQVRSLYDPFSGQINKCEQCNGDCRNFLCYGCGGCIEPPASQQLYYYPYQRQDAVYHDAFVGNAMALSGMVIYPAPKLPWIKPKQTALATRSDTSKEDDKDDKDDDDDDDDEDDSASGKGQ